MFLSDRNEGTGSGRTGAADGVKKNRDARLFILMAVFVGLFFILLYHLWKLQIVNGQKYAENYQLKITRTVRDPSTRGIIYDCNGEVLAYNEMVYTVTMTDDGVYASNRERQLSLNSIVYHVIKKLEENHDSVSHELKIEIGADGNFQYSVSGQELKRFQADVFGTADPGEMTPEEDAMSAEEMIQFLADDRKFSIYGEGKKDYTKEELQAYGLPEHYSGEELLKMVGIRYMLSLNSYKKYMPIVLARNVSEQTIAYIFENQTALPGIGVGEEWDRVYDGGEAFSHILGYTGKISPEELEAYADSERNYTSDSVVGKAGMEQYLEEHLQGRDGERQIMVNNVGKMIGEAQMIREAVSGRDVYLSIDKNLQIAVYRILEQSLAGILAGNLIPDKEFDKSGISDTSDIRIPIYDVYQALIDNEVISIADTYRTGATEPEENIAKALEEKWEETNRNLKTELLEHDVDFGQLSREMQEYILYIVNDLGIFDEDAIDKEDEVYKNWNNKTGVSTREFFLHGIEKGWLSSGVLEVQEGYFTSEETYVMLAETIGQKLKQDSEFKKLLFRWLLFQDKITGRDVCRLLYDQQVLADTDGDYERLMTGEMDSFTFMKKKIEHLQITPAQLALDPCSASAVAVQPENGRVLALVSYPGYDNSRLANQMDSAYYNQLLKDKSLPLYNRATQQLTAPGSTFKPVTIAAGLQEGIIRSDTPVFCDGIFDKVEPSLKCWKHSGHGNVAGASTALQFSCNDYMCEIAYQMGTKMGTEYADSASLKRLQEYAELFCLNQKSGIEIAESEPHVTDAYGIPSAIGQGTHNYATVQLARYAGAIASKGNAYALSLIKGVADAEGVFSEHKTVLADSIELPASVWNTVHSGMLQFAKNNDVLKDMKVNVAGKTGTAQEAENRPDHALFIGFAPAEQPGIAVAVRIANGYGSSNATAAGKSILNYYFGLQSQEEIITGEASQALNTRSD